MPNIEIYDGRGFLGGKDHSLKLKIDNIIQEAHLGDDIITTVICCRPETCDGQKKPSPFIRVCSIDPNRMEEIVEALKQHKIGMDTEKLLLSGFIPSHKME